jgi:hypothetical protein
MCISIIYGIKIMKQNSNNPLAKHFRQPAIYIKLPSNGQFWPEGSLDLPVTSEIPVYPMTARDEITIRTPDALMNGQGVVDVIQSCCPNIKDAWKMPSVDVDAILLNIRIASYGNKMDFDTECPACNEENNFSLDLSMVTDGINMPNYNTPLVFDGLSILLKPQQYFEVNRINKINFTEQQLLRTINSSTLSDDEKKAQAEDFLTKLIDLNIDICVNSTQSITTEDGTIVKNPEYIKEFYDLADYKVVKLIQDRLRDASKQAEIKPIGVTCTSCKHKFEIPLNFDYANFFA